MNTRSSYSILFKSITPLFCGVILSSVISCTNINNVRKNTIDVWLTKGDESIKLQQQKSINFNNATKNNPTIILDENQLFQSIDGFGFTLTGGSVEVINRLSAEQRKVLLNELFGNDEKSIHITYLRLSIGASDLDGEVFSYNDLKKGETDLALSQFSLEKNRDLISMLKEILAINPKIKIMATPWSPPIWMKDNESSIGGILKPEFYTVYAKYFVKYIEGMKKEGISINAITPQNEPLHPGNNPSLLMTSEMQKDFIKNHLGPTFKQAGVKTKIVVYDHNCNKPEYAIDILNDSKAKSFVDGSAFHLYEGEISALSTVHNAHPDKNVYFTEQWTGSKGKFTEDLNWLSKNVIIGSTRNWSKIALTWNLANDENFEPHTKGGCTECKGAITVNSTQDIQRNVAYYIIAHASKFVDPNSLRIASSTIESIANVAFKNPSGNIVLIAQNDSEMNKMFNIKYKEKLATVEIPAKSVSTYIIK